MTRLFCFAGLVLAAVLALGTMASAQEPNPRPMPMLVPQPGATLWTSAIGVSAHPMLQMENVQKELGLTPEQKENLKDLAKKTVEAMKAEPRFDWTKFRDMTPEERQKAQKEAADRYAKRAKECRKQVEQILTPKQVEQLKDMEFRQRAASLLYMPHVLQQIELTDEQKQQMRKIREEMQSKMSQLQRETQEKTLKMLTPEQTKKLKEMSDKGWSGWGQPVPPLPPKERPKGERRSKPVEQEDDF